MSAPLGNQFWKARSSHGRTPIFATPDDLWAAASEYFEWVDANPLWEDRIVSYQGATTHEPVAKMRAMTLGGLFIFLDITRQGFDEYRRRQDFSAVVHAIEEIIRTQKFEGASADLLNANIIARDLGLADKSEVTGKDGGAIETKDVSSNELARRLGFLLSKGLRPKEE
ncbi:DNA-packaging protein gp3 [Rhizobium mongolense subsp. loessense]|uniref:DNA-packaging protein gp3 n=1 Tax=Rhizobium mongolense subsp. loessense TaxID=158890 RepID=A0A1G4Q4T6_9HYPH|nr:DNA-packaging protein [Rhizobium mongolense]SCW39169.1 DNA-packaging protein gp3 [Rhizobium mongolense subsp. loessense]